MPALSFIDDAELVSQSLAGNREAFQEIVERYQSLICSLAYSATGSLSQSEDLGQETFLIAWKELASLREPAKLRSWLCSIVRGRIGKNFRRAQHEPVSHAEPIEEISTALSSEPLPPEQTMSREEEGILWRSLERIPETYREPLVLFYREHQSIESVAADLDLSEEAVRQRLSRGRKLLQEQVLSFVEGSLERTRPGKTFTVGVLAALPLLALGPKAAATSAATAKGGTTFKLLLMTKTTKTIILAAVVLAALTTTPLAVRYWINASQIRSIHIHGEMLTPPADNFSYIDTNQNFAPIDLWEQFGREPKWRVEKPGRVAVMDGQTTVLYMKSINEGYKINQASASAFDTDWLQRIARLNSAVSNEMHLARLRGGAVEVTQQRGSDGREKSVVTIETATTVPANDYLRDKFIDSSSTRRVYRFDARSHRLESAEIYLTDGDSDVLIFKTDKIEYNQATNAAMYHLNLPADVSWYHEPKKLPDNTKYAAMSPQEAAAAFFGACSNQDWNEAAKFMTPLTPDIEQSLASIQLISLGRPFTTKNSDTFVPYEINLRQEFNVRVSNINSAKRYVVTGFYDDKLNLQNDIKWTGIPDILTNNNLYAQMSPVEVVKAYFDAQARLDWIEMRKFTSEYDVNQTKDQVAQAKAQGMDVGKMMPVFQSGQAFYSEKESAWFVKCQIVQFKAWNLALRKDNSAGRWQVDGGI